MSWRSSERQRERQVYAAGDLRAQRAVAWWRKNRPDTSELLTEELTQAVKDLETIPHFGTPHPTASRSQLMRLMLEKTKCHVYFEVDEKQAESES